MSSYSPSLRIELITTGDQAGTWGNTTNTNLGTLIEAGIAGYTSVSATANYALTALNGAADESRNMMLALTTSAAGPYNVYAPPVEKTYVIRNTSGIYPATIYNSTVLGNTTAAGTGVTIPPGKTVTVWSDGTNFRLQNNYFDSIELGTDLAISEGGTGASTAANARTNLGLGTIATQNANAVAITGGTITGTALTGTSITGTAITGGTISNAAITGGSISGITDLAVADGGTGASTASGARTNLGLVIGTDVLAPNGNGSGLTNLNAGSLTSGTVPVTRSGSLRLTSRQNVYAGTATGTIAVSLPTSLFDGNTPSFVLFSANAYGHGITDLRNYYVCSGTSFVQDNLVLGGNSDDTDEGGVASFLPTNTFVLPYSAVQNFFVGLSWAAGTYAGLRINVIGYQV